MYYTIQNNGIIIAKTEAALTRFYDKVLLLPDDYEQGKYIVENGSLVLNPNYEEEKAQAEQERIQALFITRSDFFDCTIRAFGLTEQLLKPIIVQVLDTLPIDNTNKLVAINNFENAQNFYRKHTLFSLLSDVDLPIGEGVTINISSSQWDKFFDEANKRNPNAYKELLPSE